MSLYNMVRGHNPMAHLCLGMLGIHDSGQIARFRDAWLSDDGKEIVLLTRTGGGNRAQHKEHNEALQKRPDYLRDNDDAFDSTFARFVFAVPKEFQDDTAIIARLMLAIGNGAEAQGPGIIEQEQTKKPIAEDDPAIEAGIAAHLRIYKALIKRLEKP